MSNRRMYDASTPPKDPHWEICGFYIGGDTPHVWSDAEINGQSARWRLPIYVCDNPGNRNAVSDAGSAVEWMIRHGVPAGSALGLDYEMAIDSAYVATFDRVVVGAGFKTLLYGSLSSVMQNVRPSAGYWSASWTMVPHLDSGAVATQWASDTQLGVGYDASEVTDSLVLWDTQGGIAVVAWSDIIQGPNGRPNGNSVQNILTDVGRERDYLAGDQSAAGVYGPTTPLGQMVAAAVMIPVIGQKVEALSAPAVDPVAVGQAAAAALAADASFLESLASAIVKKMGADLAGG